MPNNPSAASPAISVLMGGDCGPVHGARDGYPIEGYTELVRPVLAQADLRFVNCMRAYSQRGAYSELAPQVDQPPEMAAIFTDGCFDAVTMANNHSYDAGPDAMLDTRALLLKSGLQVTGAGRDINEAREPVILERKGVKVGYLGYNSTGNPGSEAGPGKPGVATVRVKTCYETRGPHAPVRVITEPDPRDLKMLIDDIAALRSKVDIVILAYHSGMLRIPRVISDYQITVAHAAIDAGADLVVGHAPHVPKAIEVYKGKTIFYSLSVFSMTKPFASPTWFEPPWIHGAVGNHTELDPDYPLMPYGRDTKRSLLAKVVVGRDGVKRVSFLPMMFDSRYRPEVLCSGDPRFDDVLRYMEWASVGMPHKFTVVGDEVVVSG